MIAANKVIDPVDFCKQVWPQIDLYDKQREILYSLCDNDETIVPAGNMLGKDFIAGMAALWFFLTRHPCRIVTTSVDGTQLEGVLWGEIRRFIQSAEHPLESTRGGPLVVNHLHLRKVIGGRVDGLSYLMGRVAAKGEGMLGHHIAKTGDGVPRTLFIADEASGVDDTSYERADTWADRKLIIGNPYPCMNFFYHGVKGGDQRSEAGDRFYRKVIKIRAQDSPNVRLGEIQARKNETPTDEMLIEGVMGYSDYRKRRATWDEIRQCIGLDAEFHEGADTLLYPPDWLNRAEQIAAKLEGSRRTARAIGIDPAEGGDNTVMAAIDELGLIEMVSKKTPDTTVITSDTIAFMRKHGVKPEKIFFDRGGGGKEHADRLRKQGYRVQTVAFGEAVTPEKRRGLTVLEQRKAEDEVRYVYKNRRAQMYGLLRLRLDPNEGKGFGLPARYTELRRQLAPIPLWQDDEGRMMLPPKQRRSDATQTTNKLTLMELLGHSPDEADALVLAVYGLSYRPVRRTAGAIS